MPLSISDLKLFLAVVVSYTFDLSRLAPEDRPLTLLSKLESEGKTGAERAVKTAVSDLLASLAHAPYQRRVEISKALADVGAPSIAVVKAWLSRKKGSVLARGSIQSDDEFKTVKAVLDLPDLRPGARTAARNG